ncbi:hypothetical protein, partial [Bacillus cereus group sp. N21]|uniref:hypothetical protein n=1 Tax=Bacillus cereus group sp. N21 TaxID=2794591 RepID=UPI001A7E7B90
NMLFSIENKFLSIFVPIKAFLTFMGKHLPHKICVCNLEKKLSNKILKDYYLKFSTIFEYKCIHYESLFIN